MEFKVFPLFIFVIVVGLSSISAAPVENDVQTKEDIEYQSELLECKTVDGLVKCTKTICGWDNKVNDIICNTSEPDPPTILKSK